MFTTLSITPILSDIFIVAIMGHRIEPYVSIPTKLQTDSTGYTLDSVIHIGCYSPLRILRTVKDSYRIRKIYVMELCIDIEFLLRFLF